MIIIREKVMSLKTLSDIKIRYEKLQADTSERKLTLAEYVAQVDAIKRDLDTLKKETAAGPFQKDIQEYVQYCNDSVGFFKQEYAVYVERKSLYEERKAILEEIAKYGYPKTLNETYKTDDASESLFR